MMMEIQVAQEAPVENKGWRAAWIVIAVCLGLSFLIGARLKTVYSPQLTRTQDIVTGLLYFVESSGGRFPASEAEFRAAPFVENLAQGGVKIKPQPSSRFRKETHGVEIPNLSEFKIDWGRDLAAIEIDKRGVPRDEQGKKVELVSWSASPPSGKGYTIVILGARGDLMRDAAAGGPKTQPATQPSP